MVSRRTLLAATSYALAHTAMAQPAVHQVVIEVSDYPLAFAPVRVNGNTVRALIDTGSSSAVRLSARLARTMKLVLTPVAGRTVQRLDGQRFSVEAGTLDTLGVGDMLEHKFAIEVTGERVESIAAQVGTPFDAILGWNFLSRYSFMLDYRARALRFSEGPLRPAATPDAIPYAVVNHLPVVSARWGGQDVLLLVDTGAPMCNIDTGFARVAAGQTLTAAIDMGARRLTLQWRAKDLSVTRKALGTVGTLGNNLLGQHATTFDTRNQRLYLD